MAVATSPYQNNDYQSANTFRPYQLPVNDIVRGISAQNEFWDRGARAVKGAYENALGLDLTLDENKQFRDEFLKNAEKEITKLSSKNLADPSVQREGLNIFKPLVQDKAIIFDNALTTARNNIVNTANSFKNKKLTKDGREGEGYNQENLAFALDGFESFNSKTKRDEKYLQDLYGKLGRNEYTPYVDASEEYTKIKDKCVADVTNKISNSNGYLINDKDASLHDVQLTGCIKGGLSDGAWKQLYITGYMRLKDNPKELADRYQPTLLNENKANASSIISIKNQMEEDKKAGTLTPEIQKMYENMIDKIKGAIDVNNSRIKAFQSGDYSYISSNIKDIAGRVWADYDIGSFAKANAYEKHDIDVKGDPIYMQQLDIAEKEKDRDMQLLTALMKDGNAGGVMYKQLAQKLGIDLDATITPQGLTDPTVQETINGIDLINQQVEQGKAVLNNNIDGVYREITNQLSSDPTLLAAFEQVSRNNDGSLNYEAINDFVNKNPSLNKDESLQRLREEVGFAQFAQAGFLQKKNIIDEELKNNPDLITLKNERDQTVNEEFNKFSTNDRIIYYDPSSEKNVIFSPEQLKNIILGKDPQYTFKPSGSGQKDVSNLLLPLASGLAGLIGNDNGKIVSRSGVPLEDISSKGVGNTKSIRNLVNLPSGYNYKLASEINLSSVNDISNKFNTSATRILNDNIKSVVQNQSWNINNYPGMTTELTNAVSGYLPQLGNTKDFQVRSKGTKKGPNGETLAEIEVLKYDEKKKVFEPLGNETRELFNKELSSSTNDPYGPLILENDKVYVRTSLDKYQARSKYYEGALSFISTIENRPLANRQMVELPGTPLLNGATLGISVYGTGGKEKVYKLYIKDKDNKKGYPPFSQETSDKNTIANKYEEAISYYNNIGNKK